MLLPVVSTFRVLVLLANVAVTFPLLAVADVPLITALQLMGLLMDSFPCIPVMVMLAVCVVLLNETPLSDILALIVTESVTPDEVQPPKASELMAPRPFPARPLPLLSVPLMVEDVHVTVRPAVTSFTVVVPAFAVTAPPGLTVQVVAASAGAAANPTTDATAALRTRALPKLLRIALTPFPCRSPDALKRSGRCFRSSSPSPRRPVAAHTWPKGTCPAAV